MMLAQSNGVSFETGLLLVVLWLAWLLAVQIGRKK